MKRQPPIARPQVKLPRMATLCVVTPAGMSKYIINPGRKSLVLKPRRDITPQREKNSAVFPFSFVQKPCDSRIFHLHVLDSVRAR